MKKKTFLFLCIILLTAVLFSSCLAVARQATKGHISDVLMIDPDPNNPFQGTWIDSSKNNLYVIDGMNATWYFFRVLSYEKYSVFTIKETDYGFVMGDNFLVSVNGNTLTVGGMIYERVIK